MAVIAFGLTSAAEFADEPFGPTLSWEKNYLTIRGRIDFAQSDIPSPLKRYERDFPEHVR